MRRWDDDYFYLSDPPRVKPEGVSRLSRSAGISDRVGGQNDGLPSW